MKTHEWPWIFLPGQMSKLADAAPFAGCVFFRTRTRTQHRGTRTRCVQYDCDEESHEHERSKLRFLCLI